MRSGEEGGGADPEETSGAEPAVTREIAAEAAVWIARLHGPRRSVLMERECRAWQARSSAHRLAFERGTDLWMDAAGVTRASVAKASSAHRASEIPGAGRSTRPRWAFAVVVAAAVLTTVLVLQPWRAVDIYETGVGEQRMVILQEGSRLSLNTSTRLRVELSSARRAVDVDGGEALFEVAKDPGRPFIVKAAGSEVLATGTAFVVRRTPVAGGGTDALDVTLVEGRVVVRDATGGAVSTEVPPAVDMSPGERLRLVGRSPGRSGPSVKPQLDRPRVDQVLAWKRGEAIFDNISLAEAVSEMNRYSSMPISVADGGVLGGLRVSGVFKTGDNASFARAVAKLHGLLVREMPDRFALSPIVAAP